MVPTEQVAGRQRDARGARSPHRRHRHLALQAVAAGTDPAPESAGRPKLAGGNRRSRGGQAVQDESHRDLPNRDIEDPRWAQQGRSYELPGLSNGGTVGSEGRRCDPHHPQSPAPTGCHDQTAGLLVQRLRPARADALARNRLRRPVARLGSPAWAASPGWTRSQHLARAQVRDPLYPRRSLRAMASVRRRSPPGWGPHSACFSQSRSPRPSRILRT